MPTVEVNAAADERNETTPLLADTEIGSRASLEETTPIINSSNGVHAKDEHAPLPRLQVFLLCYARLVEPIAFFSVFPYINSMIENVGGIKEEEVGFYSGLIESLFSATEMCVMIFWGMASDKWGRKPVLVISLLGITASTGLFGFSQSIWQMILSRCLAGVFAGTIVTIRSMLSEISTKDTQARAFSHFALAGNLGIFIGNFLGGALENPTEKYPSIFGKIQIFHKYPYALPSLVTSAFSLSTAIFTTLFVKETLHVQKDKDEDSPPPMSTWQLLKHPGVAEVIAIYNYVMLIGIISTAVLPVFLYTPVRLGGIGCSPAFIAAIIAAVGICQAIWIVVVFPSLHKRVGTGRVLQLTAWSMAIFFGIYPWFNVMLRYRLMVLFWVLGPIVMLLGGGMSMSFTAVQLAVNDIAPSQETFGTLNAIILATQSGVRAVTPAIATSVYAAGVKYHILGGHLFWLTTCSLTLGLVVTLKWLPEKAEGTPSHHSNLTSDSESPNVE